MMLYYTQRDPVRPFFFCRRCAQSNAAGKAAGPFGSELLFLLAFFSMRAYNPTASSVESELKGSFHETYP
jgi:hypothetical protein